MVRRGGCAAVDDAQSPVVHLQARRVVTGQCVEPTLPGPGIDDAVGMAQLLRCTVPAIGRRRPAQQRHGDLRTEAGGQPQGVAHRISAAARQVEPAQIGVGLAVVGHRRHQAGLQHLHRHHVFDAGTHRMAGEALGVGDDDALGRRTEHVAQRADLGRGRAAARRRVGLVRDEDSGFGQRGALHAACLGLAHQRFHHRADVLQVEPRAVEGRIRRHRAQQLADRPAGHARGRRRPIRRPVPRRPCRRSCRGAGGRTGWPHPPPWRRSRPRHWPGSRW